jgi:hypothetical protein
MDFNIIETQRHSVSELIHAVVLFGPSTGGDCDHIEWGRYV